MGSFFGKTKKSPPIPPKPKPVNLLKILTIGNAGVGKTSIIFRFADNTFSETVPTLTNDYKSKDVKVREKIITVQAWDTAGQERFRTITQSFYRGAQIIMICYDITKAETFKDINKWIEEVNRFANKGVTVILVGCKSDLKSEREVTEDDAKELADKEKLKWVEVSSKDGTNIEYCFNVAIFQYFADLEKSNTDDVSEIEW
eukprot:TRINITY_DN2996_c0_g1_i1.p1 TRINITY_DN2996_c0_g1~~TRINITY_DN2996_c0_g1_i1.p1  ORF type:complete len:212 (-),score=47.41 TRINITY_DN2996_c0_g1_i1:69-671(-)